MKVDKIQQSKEYLQKIHNARIYELILTIKKFFPERDYIMFYLLYGIHSSKFDTWIQNPLVRQMWQQIPLIKKRADAAYIAKKNFEDAGGKY